MEAYRRAHFALDALEDETFEGYSTGTVWNGFACPLFDAKEAESVLRSLESATGPETLQRWEYRPEDDAFVLYDGVYDEPVVFQGQMIADGEQEVTVYPIGAYSWSWREE